MNQSRIHAKRLWSTDSGLIFNYELRMDQLRIKAKPLWSTNYRLWTKLRISQLRITNECEATMVYQLPTPD